MSKKIDNESGLYQLKEKISLPIMSKLILSVVSFLTKQVGRGDAFHKIEVSEMLFLETAVQWSPGTFFCDYIDTEKEM